MQNTLDDGTVLFTEGTDQSGFVVREMLGTRNPALRFQAGCYGRRPMQIPCYTRHVVSHHIAGDDIQVFEFHAAGRTRAEALERAANKLLRRDIANSRK